MVVLRRHREEGLLVFADDGMMCVSLFYSLDIFCPRFVPFFCFFPGKKTSFFTHIMSATTVATSFVTSSSSSSSSSTSRRRSTFFKRRSDAIIHLRRRTSASSTCSTSSNSSISSSSRFSIIQTERRGREISVVASASSSSSSPMSGGDDNNARSSKIGPTAAEPSAMDAQTFNELVSLGTWEKIVPECKRLAMIGKITDGVLGQAYLVLTACKKQGEDENVLKTLENIIQLLTQTLLQMEADSPSKRALDEMMTLNPDEVFNGKEVCREIIERTGAGVDDVVLELQKFLQNCELQDAAFERDLALATETDNREEFDRLTGLVTAKLEAKRRTLAILGYMGISE